MITELLPIVMINALEKIDYQKLYEIRCRTNCPVVVNYCGKLYYLSINGLSSERKTAIISTKNDIDYIVSNASNHSVYSISNELSQGYITYKGGIRIGVSGEIVSDKFGVQTIKNIQGLNIRIPHQIFGSANKILGFIIENKNILNTLIISPPACGKTTLIRDIIKQLSQEEYAKNYLIVDERNEIANCILGEPTLDVGDFCDIISFSSKSFAFDYSIRSMSPNVIITDEICGKDDYNALLNIYTTGVNIIASIHASNIDELYKKQDFISVLNNKIFSRYIVLSARLGAGTIEAIYDENFERLL